MKDKKTLEEIFRSKLSEREVPASPQLWDRISEGLPVEKDNVRKLSFFDRNKYLIAASLSGIVLTIAAFLFYFNDKTNNAIADKNIEPAKEINKNLNDTIKTNPRIDEKNNIT